MEKCGEWTLCTWKFAILHIGQLVFLGIITIYVKFLTEPQGRFTQAETPRVLVI